MVNERGDLVEGMSDSSRYMCTSVSLELASVPTELTPSDLSVAQDM